MSGKPGAPLPVRFWAKVAKSDGCWEWTGPRLPRGYGVIRADGRQTYAHRVSWLLHFGPIPDRAFVLHHCDNPPCVNPAHLWVGSQADNVRDMIAKGRARYTNHARGDQHPVRRNPPPRDWHGRMVARGIPDSPRSKLYKRIRRHLLGAKVEFRMYEDGAIRIRVDHPSNDPGFEIALGGLILQQLAKNWNAAGLGPLRLAGPIHWNDDPALAVGPADMVR